MDYQNRAGSRFGSGGVAGKEETAMDRRQRLYRLARSTIDPANDPYWRKNHLGMYECKLCLTVHVNDASYLAHTQAKKHQNNLAMRGAKEQNVGIRDPSTALLMGLYQSNTPAVRKNFMKIGLPGQRNRGFKIRDPTTRQNGLFFQLQFPLISGDVKPRFRFMSAWEQKVEQPDKRFQYLVVAAEPYESVAFKIPNREVDQREGMLWSHWDRKFPLFPFFRQMLIV